MMTNPVIDLDKRIRDKFAVHAEPIPENAEFTQPVHDLALSLMAGLNDRFRAVEQSGSLALNTFLNPRFKMQAFSDAKKATKLRKRAPQLEAAASEKQRDLLSSFEDIGVNINHSDNEASSSDFELDEVSTRSDPSAPPTIKTSTPTRWHSMLMMLTSISHNANRRPIRDMLIDIGRSALLLDENEYNLITSLTSFFDKFKKTVECLSNESQTTINLALIFKSEIRRLLEEYNDDEPVIVTRLKNNMLQRLDHCFPVTDETRELWRLLYWIVGFNQLRKSTFTWKVKTPISKVMKVTPPTPPPPTSKSRRAAANRLNIGAHIQS
ncbi:unnamed protein product [Parnassius apollo]|uniref:(apollo) hypothetical protein n=1 Tax=Parnassius apollo TaxID=110799 RepID=A0A8S3XNA4_PARAO|nr:unnamed protein product [Parnassius apollo]